MHVKSYWIEEFTSTHMDERLAHAMVVSKFNELPTS